VRIGLFSVPYLASFGKMRQSAPNYVPLGTASLAAFLKKQGHDVTAIACDLSRISIEEGIRRLFAFKPDMIGLSATTPGFPLACSVAKTLKEKTDVPVCVGGIHVSARPCQSLKECSAVDMVVVGEGERPLLDLVSCIENDNPLSGSSPPGGVVWRDGHNIVEGHTGAFLDVLDELPFPAYERFDVRNCRPPVYFDFGIYPAVNIITSRGCPSKCSFCVSKLTMGSRYRVFSSLYVLELIRYLIKDFGVRFISITDDTFTLQKTRVYELCDMLRRSKLDIRWTCFSRPDGMDQDLAKTMRKAGCVGVNFGVETGSEAMLVHIGKGARLHDSITAVKAARAAGLRIVCSFMSGFPKETPEMAEDTIRFAMKLNPDIALFNTLVPYPGSFVSMESLQPQDYDGIDWTVMRTSTTGEGPVFEGNRTAKDLVRWVKRANRKFYIRPGFITKIPRLMPHTLKVIPRYLSGILGLISKTINMKADPRFRARQ
jgi:anaerobic magnesium-protoporphyrin IX monomethyl ester cyclase